MNPERLYLFRGARELKVKPTVQYLLAGLLLCVLAGCSSTGSKQSDSRYSMSQDAPPTDEVDLSGLEDPVPRAEPHSRGGNRSPYTVWGKSYQVLDSADGYQTTGIASWYGAKFHGHKTSNGETYDMYALSAAHRNLPLPSFVEVTNLENNRRVIVRVNDRGPFHSERIIDLSYAAARKLGFADKGTARVRVAAITVNADGSWVVAGQEDRVVAGSAVQSAAGDDGAGAGGLPYLQVGAFRSADSAAALRARLQSVTGRPVVVSGPESGDGWHRVRVGPFESRAEARSELQRIEASRLGEPIIVMRNDGV